MKRLRRIIKKIRNKRGFSLSELLLSTLIMLFATSILTATISLAVKSYDRSIAANNANILCKTISLALRDKLSNAVQYDPSADQYYSTRVAQAYYPFKINIDDGTDLLAAEDGNFGQVVISCNGTAEHLATPAAYGEGINELVVECIVKPEEINRNSSNTSNTSNTHIKLFNVTLNVAIKGKEKSPVVTSEFIVYPIGGDIAIK